MSHALPARRPVLRPLARLVGGVLYVGAVLGLLLVSAVLVALAVTR